MICCVKERLPEEKNWQYFLDISSHCSHNDVLMVKNCLNYDSKKVKTKAGRVHVWWI